MKRRDLERHLRNHGCLLGRHGARHDVWANGAAGTEATVPRHREIKTALARAICQQLGIPAPPGR